MSIRKKLASPSVQTAVLMALAVLLLWWFFRGTDLDAIQAALARADLFLISCAVAAALVTYVIRAIRWRVLLRPLGKAGLWNCFSTTVIGFMVNFLAGRLGEIARPYILARKEGFSASSTFATIFLERILDLVTIVLLIGFWLLTSPLPASSEDVLRSLELGGGAAFGGAVLALAALFVLARHPDRALPWMKRLFGILPARLEAAMGRFAEMFAEGLAVLVDARQVAWAAAWSVLLWANISFAFWLGSLAIGVDFPYGDTFLVIGFLTVGVAVPTPGAVGGYHVMCALALTTLFATDASLARAVAIVNHAISFVPVTLLGLFFFIGGGFSFAQLRRTNDESESSSSSHSDINKFTVGQYEPHSRRHS